MGRVHSGGVGSILLHTGGAQWREQPITWRRIKNIELHRGPPHPPRSPHYGKPRSVQFSFLDTFFIRASTFYLRMVVPSCFWIVRLKWDKVLKSGPIEIYDKQPLKKFTWSIL